MALVIDDQMRARPAGPRGIPSLALDFNPRPQSLFSGPGQASQSRSTRIPLRVLLVDDDPEFTRFTTLALEEAGIQYATAGSVEAGLTALREAEAGSFDLILLDVTMPGATGGISCWTFESAATRYR